MSAPFREQENHVRELLQRPVVQELVARYTKENPKAANDPHLVMHALIAPLCRGAKSEGWREKDSWTCFELFLKMELRLSPAECELVLRIIGGEQKLPRRR